MSMCFKLRVLFSAFDSAESFDPEPFGLELITERLTTEGLTTEGLVAGHILNYELVFLTPEH